MKETIEIWQKAVEKRQQKAKEYNAAREEAHETEKLFKEKLHDYGKKVAGHDLENWPFEEGPNIYEIEGYQLWIDFDEGEIVRIEIINPIKLD